MKRNSLWPLKAYKNSEFLGSPEARPIRVLSEYLEPLRRFRQLGIRDTIIFFGSARTLPRASALRHLTRVESEAKRRAKLGRDLLGKFESAKIDLDMSRYYEEAVELSRLLTEWSLTLKEKHRFVVCSGGGPGIMEAANRGAKLAGGISIGLNIRLPFEQSPNKYITKALSFEFHYFFIRKFWFAYPGKALVVFPGGFGTLDELFEVLTLSQTGKIKKKMTVLVYGKDYWDKIIDFNAMCRFHTISQKDLKLLSFADTPRDAFNYLRAELTKNYLRGNKQNRGDA